jgi:hypothetical protein
VDVEGEPAEAVHGGVGAEDLEIEAVAVEGDDAREGFELGDEPGGVLLEPAAELVLGVPRDGDGEAEGADVAPASLDLVGEAQRLNIQIDFAIE